VNGTDAGMAALEREQKRNKGRIKSWEEWRQVARAVREIAALPGPSDPRPVAPGASVNGRRDGAATRGGLAAAILADLHGSPVDAPPAPPDPIAEHRARIRREAEELEVELPAADEDD
jgi:hypothetical protein